MRMLVGVLLGSAVALAGCGDDVSALDSSVNMDLSVSRDLLFANTDLVGTHLVTIGPADTLTFAPNTLSIATGDTVLWTVETGDHTVTSGPFTGTGAGVPDGKFCSGAPVNPTVGTCSAETGHGPGFMYEHRFDAAGTFTYFCNVHGITMHGTINVQ